MEELLATVSQHGATSGLLHFWVKPTSQSERTANTVSMDRQVQELIIYQQGSPVPSECEALRDIDLQSAYFQELVTQHMSAQSIPTTVAAHIESITREQSKSSLWHQLHNGRITSSIFGDIIHRRESRAPDNLIKRIIGYGDHHVKTKAMTWGLANESKAQRAYVQHCESLRQMLPLSPVAYPCTPDIHTLALVEMDGLCQDHTRVGMLEVKCSVQLRRTW